MRIFLQQISSGRFLAEDGTWTDQQLEAKPFRHFVEALAFARDGVAGPVGAYCAFRDASCNFSVYLQNAAGAATWEAKVRPFRQLEDVTRPWERA